MCAACECPHLCLEMMNNKGGTPLQPTAARDIGDYQGSGGKGGGGFLAGDAVTQMLACTPDL